MSIEISVLLPTRGRPGALEHCLTSLIKRIKNPEQVEILLAFDNDDLDHIAHFENLIVPWLEDTGVSYTAFNFNPMGYIRLNEYLNKMAEHAQGNWYFFWNDDASMVTANWDQVIRKYDGQMRLLRATTNHEHPYAIFPIVPKKWVEITGNLSPHQINDAWVSQIGWMLDIVETIDVHIHHHRADLTGDNNDDTYRRRIMLEGYPNRPGDFNHYEWRKRRVEDAMKLAEYIERTENRVLTHFRDGLDNRIDIWAKMKSFDTRNQMVTFSVNE